MTSEGAHMDEQAIPISYLHPHWTSEADMGRKFNSSEDESVSASELAQMGVCERMVWFDHLYGRRFTPQRRMAAARGQRLHQHFYEQGIRQKQGTRCCVAAHVFGDPSPEVAALRKYRDEVLRSTRYGQVLIDRKSVV